MLGFRLRMGGTIRSLSLVCALLVMGAAPVAFGQGENRAPGPVARGVHDRGHYPNDLLVEPEPEPRSGGAHGSAGSGGRGSRRPIPIYGGRGSPDLAPDAGDMSLPDWFPRFGIPRWLGWLFGMLGRGAMVLVIVAIVLLVAGIVYLLFRFRQRPSDVDESKPKRVGKRGETAEGELDPLLAMPTLGHAELARQGRFREAVHALLVMALLSTGWTPEGRGRGMTAREIANGYQNPSPPREPLLELLALVERVWFGGREATAESYATALAAFQRFVPEPARPA